MFGVFKRKNRNSSEWAVETAVGLLDFQMAFAAGSEPSERLADGYGRG